jgi:hypothetical protein
MILEMLQGKVLDVEGKVEIHRWTLCKEQDLRERFRSGIRMQTEWWEGGRVRTIERIFRIGSIENGCLYGRWKMVASHCGVNRKQTGFS